MEYSQNNVVLYSVVNELLDNILVTCVMRNTNKGPITYEDKLVQYQA